MAQRTDTFDLGRLGLSSGEGRSLDLRVPVDAFEYGGQRYVAGDEPVEARLDVARTTGGGYSLRLRFGVTLRGPCVRCLEDATPSFTIDAREVEQPGGGDELESPYVDGDLLDVRAWARDALALELPTQIVCREDCAGICPVCGENLNEAGPEHHHEEAPDPRWAKLKELRFDV